MGVVSGAIATHYEISITAATASFSYLTTGVLAGSFLSMLVNPLLGSRRITSMSAIMLMASLIALRWMDTPSLLPTAFFIIGVSCGLLLATSAIVITGVYREHHRPSALLATDSFYSFAGFAVVPAAGWVIAQSMHWTSAYLIAFVATLLLGAIALATEYPPESDTRDDLSEQSLRWPIVVYLVGSALFVYIVSFIWVYAWVPVYASSELGVSADVAGILVGRFFLGLFIGQLAVFFLALRLDVRLILGVIGGASVLCTIGLWASQSVGLLGVALLSLGVVTGGLLKLLIAFGTGLVAKPTSRLVGFYMFCTAFGSSIAPLAGARVVEASDAHFALVLVTAGYVTTCILLAFAFRITRATSR